MKIKTLIIISILIFFTSNSFSQNFRLSGGYNLTKQIFGVSSDSYYKKLPGWHVSTGLDFPISEKISISTGATLITKGYRYLEDDLPYFNSWDLSFNRTYDQRLKTYNLDIPIILRVDLLKLKNIDFTFQFGPYIGFALSGKFKSEMYCTNISDMEFFLDEGFIESDSYENEIVWDTNNLFNNRLDIGLIVGTGIKIRSVEFNISYDTGFIDNVPNRPGRSEILRLSVGYIFKKKAENS